MSYYNNKGCGFKQCFSQLMGSPSQGARECSHFLLMNKAPQYNIAPDDNKCKETNNSRLTPWAEHHKLGSTVPTGRTCPDTCRTHPEPHTPEDGTQPCNNTLQPALFPAHGFSCADPVFQTTSLHLTNVDEHQKQWTVCTAGKYIHSHHPYQVLLQLGDCAVPPRMQEL